MILHKPILINKTVHCVSSVQFCHCLQIIM